MYAFDKDETPLYRKLLHGAGQDTGARCSNNAGFDLFSEPLVCHSRDISFYSSGNRRHGLRQRSA